MPKDSRVRLNRARKFRIAHSTAGTIVWTSQGFHRSRDRQSFQNCPFGTPGSKPVSHFHSVLPRLVLRFLHAESEADGDNIRILDAPILNPGTESPCTLLYHEGSAIAVTFILLVGRIGKPQSGIGELRILSAFDEVVILNGRGDHPLAGEFGSQGQSDRCVEVVRKALITYRARAACTAPALPVRRRR